MSDWKWNGARWWKFDFHAHTPESDDYGKGPNQETLKKRTPKEWVLDYMRAGVDCVAVTDHNASFSRYGNLSKRRNPCARNFRSFEDHFGP
jgi:hypothetical protein